MVQRPLVSLAGVRSSWTLLCSPVGALGNHFWRSCACLGGTLGVPGASLGRLGLTAGLARVSLGLVGLTAGLECIFWKTLGALRLLGCPGELL